MDSIFLYQEFASSKFPLFINSSHSKSKAWFIGIGVGVGIGGGLGGGGLACLIAHAVGALG